MNDDWLHRVHDRMTDYEIDEPDNLWAAIEERQAEESTRRRLSRHNVILMWTKLGVAAAVVLALAVALWLYMPDDPVNISEIPAHVAMLEEPIPDHSVAEKAPTVTYVADMLRRTSGRDHAVDIHEGNIPGMLMDAVSADTLRQRDAADGEKRDNAIDTVRPDNDSAADANKRIYREDNRILAENSRIASIRTRGAVKDKFSLSMFTSGQPGSLLNSHSTSNVFVGCVGPDNSVWKDKLMLGILAFNQGKDIETEIRHRIPLKAGITLAYNINDRLGIESGVSYTNLTSDIREGSRSHYFTGKQILHYIGVPVNLRYRVISWKRFDVYASAGVLVDKCVSAKVDKDFVLDNKEEGSKSENIPDRPVQVSVNSAVGLQCNLVKSVGLYVEPGVSYYFKDGSNIRTIYKEKPLNFNLNAGVRFTFGK